MAMPAEKNPLSSNKRLQRSSDEKLQRSSDKKLQTIAIIGGGFSGVAAAYDLVRLATKPIEILAFDESLYGGKGVAYSTNCPLHLLNVTADNMGILKEDPLHFFKWLQTYPQEWRSLAPEFKSIEFDAKSYVPRMIFGRYLDHISEETQAEAKRKDIILKKIAAQVQNLEMTHDSSLLLTTANNQTYVADGAILAIGLPGTRKFPGTENSDFNKRYLQNLWPDFTDMPTSKEICSKLNKNSTVGLIGSGLTMLDAIATLHSMQYRGKIVVFAHKGLLPIQHNKLFVGPHPQIQAADFPKTAVGVLKKLRELCKGPFEQGQSWQDVFAWIRHITVSVWKQLPVNEQRRLLSHLSSYWTAHRHRASPDIRKLLNQYTEQKQLKIINGRALALKNNPQGKMVISYTTSGSKKENTLDVDLVVNCSGPDMLLKNHSSKLIHNLLDQGLIQEDQLGLGIAIDSRGSAIGKAQDKLFAAGVILFGTLFESIAVPELRGHASLAASNVLESIGVNTARSLV